MKIWILEVHLKSIDQGEGSEWCGGVNDLLVICNKDCCAGWF